MIVDQVIQIRIKAIHATFNLCGLQQLNYYKLTVVQQQQQEEGDVDKQVACTDILQIDDLPFPNDYFIRSFIHFWKQAQVQSMDCGMYNLKVTKTHGVIDEETIINTGAASTSTNQPAILAKEQQSDAIQEPKSKELLLHLIGHVNGVSVHCLRTILLQEVRGAGLDDNTATIYDMEDLRESKHGIIRFKGSQHTCPRDGKLGAAYVDGATV